MGSNNDDVFAKGLKQADLSAEGSNTQLICLPKAPKRIELSPNSFTLRCLLKGP